MTALAKPRAAAGPTTTGWAGTAGRPEFRRSWRENIREAVNAWLWAEDQKALAGLSEKERSLPIIVTV